VAQFRISLLMTATLLCAAPALGGIYEDLYRGLQIYATPLGSPLQSIAGGGVANGNRFGRLRIMPNEIGEGYRLELDRNFGSDSRGRPEIIDLGNYELQLSGVTSGTAGYTTRGIPTGNIAIFADNLDYALRAKSGAQDLQVIGTLDVNEQIEINQWGFYSIQFEISNVDSSLIANGLAIDGELDTDFDLGPISASGNVFFDAALALLTSFGVDTESLEGVFPESPIDRINDDIEAFFERQTQVLSSTAYADLSVSTLSAEDVLSGGAPTTGVIALDDLQPGAGVRVPEPAGLLLLGMLAAAGLRRRS
jgi:hypothetical protein